MRGGRKKEPAASVPGGGTLGMAGALAGFDVGSFSAASGCASLLEVRAGGLADQRSSGVD